MYLFQPPRRSTKKSCPVCASGWSWSLRVKGREAVSPLLAVKITGQCWDADVGDDDVLMVETWLILWSLRVKGREAVSPLLAVKTTGQCWDADVDDDDVLMMETWFMLCDGDVDVRWFGAYELSWLQNRCRHLWWRKTKTSEAMFPPTHLVMVRLPWC